MFGLKTKKTKRIEALETQLYSMCFKQPHVITTQGNVMSLAASQILEEGMPAKFAKQEIARRLIDEAIKFIHYDLESHNDGKNILKGYIQVVTYGTDVNR